MKKINVELLQKNLFCRFSEEFDQNNLLGISVLLRQEGEVIYRNNFGYFDVAKTKRLDSSALFRIASMTKPVTAAAVLMLKDRGLLDLDVPVEYYLPRFANLKRGERSETGELILKGPLSRKPTVKHLLTHSALIDFGPLFALQERKMSQKEKRNLGDSLSFYSELFLEKEPGMQHAYSPTVAFDILAGIIEAVAGKPYEDFMNEELFAPLGMRDTTFSPTEAQNSRMIEMHNKVDGTCVRGNTYDGCVFEDYPPSHPLGGAGLASTVGDYDRFAAMLLNGGEWEGRRYLAKDTVKLMATIPFPGLKGSHHQWGLGVRVVACDDGILPRGSFGWSGAYGSHFWVDPENRITAVFMRNSRYDGGGESLMNQNFEKDVMSALL